MTLREFSDTLTHFPFHNSGQISTQTSQTGCEKFTAVIYTTLTSASSSATSKIAASGVHLSAPIFKLARNVAASSFAQQVNNSFSFLKIGIFLDKFWIWIFVRCLLGKISSKISILIRLSNESNILEEVKNVLKFNTLPYCVSFSTFRVDEISKM